MRGFRRVPQELAAGGFGVGVHDLHHDGSLYGSRKAFEAEGIKLNRYLKQWGAALSGLAFALRGCRHQSL